MSSWYERKKDYGTCSLPEQQQQQHLTQQQPQLPQLPQLPQQQRRVPHTLQRRGTFVDFTEPEPRDWEDNGTVFNLVLDVASVAYSRIFLLLALVFSLEAGADRLMRCSQEETPELKNSGEELMCHYTKAFLFTFPAMATTVLILLMGRDFLQKRLYYGLLKHGGVITFSENASYKDPVVVAMFIDFLHCAGYFFLHLLVLHRQGKDVNAVSSQGFVPEVSAVEASRFSGLDDVAAFFLAALRGGGPKLGGGAKGAGRGSRQKSYDDDDSAFGGYMATVMMLVATFMETVLLIIFIWYAYDITATLVPMSEYLDAYEDVEGKCKKDIPRLHTFKDTTAKRILEDSEHVMHNIDGNLDKMYYRVVTKYKAHKHEIRGTPHNLVDATPSLQDQSPRRFSWHTLRELSSIGLTRSLWPAQLLLRREVQGHEPKKFRRAWIMYAILALAALASVLFLLIMEMLREFFVLVGSHHWDMMVPMGVLMVHSLIVCVAVWSFVESIAPLIFTRQPMQPAH